MMMSDILTLQNHIKMGDNILIVTHEHPDGDALGTVFAFLLYCQAENINATCLIPEKIPDYVSEFAPTSGIVESVTPEKLTTFTTTFAFDCSNAERLALGELEFDTIKDNTTVINIDHHVDNKQFGHINIITSAAATAELLGEFLLSPTQIKKISSEIATNLLLGIITDTGCYRYANTSSTVFNISATLLELGAEQQKIIQNTFYTKPIKNIRFEGALIAEQLKLECDGRYAWVSLDEELLKRFDIDLNEIDGVSELIRPIASADVIATLTKRGTGVKFSLRSKVASISVGEIARRLGGGGHELAAGGFIPDCDFAVAEKILLEQVSKQLG
jgi:phosphoesterase RecJ-like protein